MEMHRAKKEIYLFTQKYNQIRDNPLRFICHILYNLRGFCIPNVAGYYNSGIPNYDNIYQYYTYQRYYITQFI